MNGLNCESDSLFLSSLPSSPNDFPSPAEPLQDESEEDYETSDEEKDKSEVPKKPIARAIFQEKERFA